ncbi:hypothetical protein DCAR_0623175 [Daucus carota subsp. sativus]|uniref:Uncharacterized protein n=1 Tax=Daucus carota subsp. sativus TaxID=79200 RepID=A0AAF0X9N6_DAUCS|nr:hypothetical protein DCAR_0623175 [Daucus carota subsp. sativus]
MKRAFVKNNQHDDAKMQSKYQGLLQDYLELQKEFVAKKKKLRSVIVKRDTLLGEVSFLRRRHKQLLKAKSVTPLALDYDQAHLPSSKGKFCCETRKIKKHKLQY